MNWLQKIFKRSQSSTPGYLDIGHEKVWGDPVILWWYDNGLQTQFLQEAGDAHSTYIKDTKPIDLPGTGRIDPRNRHGSISFGTEDMAVRKQIIQALISKYPHIKFFVYSNIGTLPLQEYWQQNWGY